MKAIIWMCVAVSCCVKLATASAQPWCDSAKHPIIILPGIMASQINSTYSGFAAGSPCVGRKRMTTVWPPSAKLILPTGLSCWMYMVQTTYNPRSKRFGNNRGVRIYVDPGGQSGTEYHLWQSSYTNLTSYLTQHFGYTLGRDMFGAPFDWRLHISGMERAGQMKALANKIESAVRRNCGKKAVVIGHSMGGLVTYALLHRDPDWTEQYIGGFISVSAPFGGTSDQAIAVRMGAVDFNIQDWVKMPMARAAADMAASHRTEVAVAVANMQNDGGSYQQTQGSDDVSTAADDDNIEVPLATQSRMRMRRPGRKIASVTDGSSDEIAVPRRPIAVAVKDGVTAVKERLISTAEALNLDKLVSDYVSGIFYKATIGLPGLSMLLPYASAYGSNRRIVVTEKETYTASMMQQLMADIGDMVTAKSWQQVHELEDLLEQGPVPGVPVHCIYAVGKGTTLTWDFPNIKENKPLLSSTPLVTTGGDGTVSVQSLRQCDRITESANITELGDYGHLEVLKNPSTLAELGKALSAILNLGPATAPQTLQRLSDDGSGGSAHDSSSSNADHGSSSMDNEMLMQSSAADVVIAPERHAAVEYNTSSSSSSEGSSAAAEAMLPAAQPVLPIRVDAEPVTESVLLMAPLPLPAARAEVPFPGNRSDTGTGTSFGTDTSPGVVGPAEDILGQATTPVEVQQPEQVQEQQESPLGSNSSSSSSGLNSSALTEMPAQLPGESIEQPIADKQQLVDIPAPNSQLPDAAGRAADKAAHLNSTQDTDEQQQQQQQEEDVYQQQQNKEEVVLQQEPSVYIIDTTGQPIAAQLASPAVDTSLQQNMQGSDQILHSGSAETTVTSHSNLSSAEAELQLPAGLATIDLDHALNAIGLGSTITTDMVGRHEAILNNTTTTQGRSTVQLDGTGSSSSGRSSNSSIESISGNFSVNVSPIDTSSGLGSSSSNSSSEGSSIGNPSTGSNDSSSFSTDLDVGSGSSSSNSSSSSAGNSGSAAMVEAGSSTVGGSMANDATAQDDIIAVHDTVYNTQYRQQPNNVSRRQEPQFIAVSDSNAQDPDSGSSGSDPDSDDDVPDSLWDLWSGYDLRSLDW